MAEVDPYLSRIFGDGALTVHTTRQGGIVVGSYSWEKGIAPLREVLRQPQGETTLIITHEHCSGHFLGPETLPAYRMLELGAMMGEEQQVGRITNAQFRRIIRSGDVVSVLRKRDTGIMLTRDLGGQPQEIASAEITFTDQGNKPEEIGALFEIAAQTVVANVATRRPDDSELLYPLILGVGEITIFSKIDEHLCIVPTLLGNMGKKGMLTGSAEIRSVEGGVVAHVTDIQFEFATASKIEFYDNFGRNFP